TPTCVVVIAEYAPLVKKHPIGVSLVVPWVKAALSAIAVPPDPAPALILTSRFPALSICSGETLVLVSVVGVVVNCPTASMPLVGAATFWLEAARPHVAAVVGLTVHA